MRAHGDQHAHVVPGTLLGRMDVRTPRLLAWSRRAIARVEREYAPEGPRGREIIEGWEAFQ